MTARGTLTLTADDGTDPPVSDSLTLSVSNALPVVNAGPDQFVTIGDTVSLAPATFTDGGTNDTHSATINWGDGTIEPGVVTRGRLARAPLPARTPTPQPACSRPP